LKTKKNNFNARLRGHFCFICLFYLFCRKEARLQQAQRRKQWQRFSPRA
jgi:hypothetical protein